jgi:hypothetical protein
MSSLIVSAAEVAQWLPVLVGSSVFGLTASLGQLLTEEEEEPDTEDDPRTIRVVSSGLRLRTERRQALRRASVPVRVEVRDRRSGWIERGWVVDRSRAGLGLELDTAPRLGGVLDVRSCNTPGQEVWLLAVVRNCLETMDCWKVGCQFVQPPPSGVLQLFG